MADDTYYRCEACGIETGSPASHEHIYHGGAQTCWPVPTCPDGGTCHHACAATCFRVETCGPLSGVFPGDRWPVSALSNPAPVRA